MFGNLTEKFQNIVSRFAGQKKLTEENISDAVREVRLALLDADVNYTVASSFVKRVKEKALGESVLKAVSPADQFISIVHETLVELMGKEEPKLHLDRYPATIMMCGLQGSGKTTQSAKLAKYLAPKKTLLIACDRQRPAAVLQLKTLGAASGVDVFDIEGATDPLLVAKKGMEKANKEGYEVVIVDTAGRLAIDDELMRELNKLKEIVQPSETLFVASAMLGQDAVKTAHEFQKQVGITGTILTMLDGNARAGAAISILEVTQKPLKFEGIGEKLDDFQLFNPHSMADRILGMGDVINLVRKAQAHINEEDAASLQKKMEKGSFTYEDYLKQMGQLKKMGPLKSLLKMIPGLPDLGDLDLSDGQFKSLEAMILSMTPKERKELVELDPSRRRRIAKGSGVTIDDVNRMVKSFKGLKQMMKKMPSMKKSLGKSGDLQKLFSK